MASKSTCDFSLYLLISVTMLVGEMGAAAEQVSGLTAILMLRPTSFFRFLLIMPPRELPLGSAPGSGLASFMSSMLLHLSPHTGAEV